MSGLPSSMAVKDIGFRGQDAIHRDLKDKLDSLNWLLLLYFK
jgi:hypothetical protein